MAFKKPLAAVAATALAATLAACGGGSDDGNNNSGSSGGKAEKGGNAIFLVGVRNVEHWDPQRMYIGRDLNNSGRLFYRSLVALPASNDPKEGTTPVADLATDTGTTTEIGRAHV